MMILEVTFWLSIFGPLLGSFVIFRKMSFAGDALAHSSLGGVAVAYLFVGAQFWVLSLGAIVSVFLAMALFRYLEQAWKIPSDLALTLSYTSLFAIGLALMGRQGEELQHFLVGDLFNVAPETLPYFRIWAVVVVGLVLWQWKGLWLCVVDPQMAASLGYRSKCLDTAFLVMLAVSIVGMIQTVGVVLVATYLIVPPVAMLVWARSLRSLAIGSVLIAFAVSGLGYIASQFFQLPSGPVFTLSAFLLMSLSLLIKWIHGQLSDLI